MFSYHHTYAIENPLPNIQVGFIQVSVFMHY